MRAKGIAYDTGFIQAGGISRERFDPDVVRRELAIIRDGLHCNAVQITGGDPDRLELAAGHAAELGLEVWFSPYPLELAEEEILALFADCARRAERLRRQGAEVVFVTGVELSLMNRGFVPGDSPQERVGLLLGDPQRRIGRIAEAGARLNDFLRTAVAVVREHFQGKVTYAAVPFERVDWALFDIMSLELIRSAEVADRYRDGVRALVAQGKPLAITGFGAATWRGAGDVAPRSMEIVEYDEKGAPLRLDGEYVRDEAGQAAYLTELLELFEEEGVDSAFVFLFALENLPHRPDGDPATIWTWPASASSRSSKIAAGAPTPACPGNPRPPSRPSPTATPADSRQSIQPAPARPARPAPASGSLNSRRAPLPPTSSAHRLLAAVATIQAF